MQHLTHEKLSDWIIPALLATLCGILSWMGATLNDISANLAVATSRIEDHEKRLDRIDSVVFHPRQ